jgi:hypothetical protein
MPAASDFPGTFATHLIDMQDSLKAFDDLREATLGARPDLIHELLVMKKRYSLRYKHSTYRKFFNPRITENDTVDEKRDKVIRKAKVRPDFMMEKGGRPNSDFDSDFAKY